MGMFVTPLVLKTTGLKDKQGRALYKLDQDLIYRMDYNRHELTLVVPNGRMTNLATLPRSIILRWLYYSIADIDGKFIAAAVLHDYLCNETFTPNPCDEPVEAGTVSGMSRFMAAAHFREALRDLGAPSWQSFTAYWAVRFNDAYVWLSSLANPRDGRYM